MTEPSDAFFEAMAIWEAEHAPTDEVWKFAFVDGWNAAMRVAIAWAKVGLVPAHPEDASEPPTPTKDEMGGAGYER